MFSFQLLAIVDAILACNSMKREAGWRAGSKTVAPQRAKLNIEIKAL
jgi:hypothetical protein